MKKSPLHLPLLRKALLLALALLAPAASLALQVVEPVEGANSFVRISAKELTRVAVENGKIASLVVTEGDLIVQRDEDRGQIFIRPLVSKPINMRLITSAGSTYSLVMQAVDIPQEDVIVRDAAIKAANEAQAQRDGKLDPYKKAIRDLIVGMAGDTQVINAEPRVLNREIALWRDTRFVLLENYNYRDLAGDKYQLTNIGAKPMRLAEQELYRSGVVAVAIETMSLDPGQSTFVYVVRRN